MLDRSPARWRFFFFIVFPFAWKVKLHSVAYAIMLNSAYSPCRKQRKFYINAIFRIVGIVQSHVPPYRRRHRLHARVSRNKSSGLTAKSSRYRSKAWDTREFQFFLPFAVRARFVKIFTDTTYFRAHRRWFRMFALDGRLRFKEAALAAPVWRARMWLLLVLTSFE